LYASPNIIRVIKSVRMKLVGIQDAWVRWIMHTKFWSETWGEETTRKT